MFKLKTFSTRNDILKIFSLIPSLGKMKKHDHNKRICDLCLDMKVGQYSSWEMKFLEKGRWKKNDYVG